MYKYLKKLFLNELLMIFLLAVVESDKEGYFLNLKKIMEEFNDKFEN